MSACTLNARHSWQWQRNAAVGATGISRAFAGQYVRLKSVGIYRCACGALKTVTPHSTAPAQAAGGAA